MKKIILLLLVSGLFTELKAQKIGDIIKTATGVATGVVNGNGQTVSNDEVVKGLKEALSVGVNKAGASASKTDGFNKNSLIKIPFPPEAKQMETTLKSMGMTKQLNKFTETLNRAAEKAAKDAAPIFLKAITSMSLTDGISILKGGDNAATKFLQDKTTTELKGKFKPVVAAALKSVQITKYWNPLATTYNKVPMVQKVNPNLEDYVTIKAIEGMFKLVGQEETKIRKDPASRISDLLKKVFG